MAEIGRWATVDPLAEKYQSWSLYHYTMNSLIVMTDPTGIAPMHIDVSMNGDGTIQERMERGTKSGVSSAKMVKEMGKILVVAILAYFAFLMASVLMSDGVKYVYCLSDDKCVTVWKKSNVEVYLILALKMIEN